MPPIRPLAWELPYAPGAALKTKRKKKKKRFGCFTHVTRLRLMPDGAGIGKRKVGDQLGLG